MQESSKPGQLAGTNQALKSFTEAVPTEDSKRSTPFFATTLIIFELGDKNGRILCRYSEENQGK